VRYNKASTKVPTSTIVPGLDKVEDECLDVLMASQEPILKLDVPTSGAGSANSDHNEPIGFGQSADGVTLN
jgi:hypothetical protein